MVIFSAIFALGLSSLLVYLLADADVIALNGQSQGILFILVFGAATDYALLLVSRYREELRIEKDKYAAMRTAWARDARTRRGVCRNGHRGRSVPVALRPELEPRTRSGGRHRYRRVLPRVDDVPTRCPGSVREDGVLADQAEVRCRPRAPRRGERSPVLGRARCSNR